MYGGTFDPVHYGHLKPVEILANLIGLQRVIIMPNNVPPHRPQPEATSEQRKAMLALAIADKPLFTLDERELRRDTPSWTSQTLREWRAEQGPMQPLAFIIGQVVPVRNHSGKQSSAGLPPSGLPVDHARCAASAVA